MCMERVNLSLKYDEAEKDFVGIGYKALDIVDSIGRINYSKAKPEYGSKGKDGWFQATGDYDPTQKVDFSSVQHSDNKVYWPGFHIFLNKQDAVLYGGGHISVIQVSFKGVTAFGTNSNRNGGSGPCVIAKKMKFLKVEKMENKNV